MNSSTGSVYFGTVEFQQSGNIYNNGNPAQLPFFNTATFLGNGLFYGNNDFMTLNLAPEHSYQFEPGSNTKILAGGNLNASGPDCNGYITFISTIAGSTANLNTLGVNLTLQYVAVMDIAVTGGGTITAQNSIDLGNNSAWNFTPPPPRTLYWVGDGGNWSDVTHWSLSSGGPVGECIPSAYDNVIFDQNSGFSTPGQVVTIDIDIAYCHDMNWQGVQNAPGFATSNLMFKLFIYGSVEFDPAMSLDLPYEVYFRSNQVGETIFSAGQDFTYNVHFDGVGGEWSFTDAFSAGAIFQTAGTIRTNNNNVHIGYFGSNGSALYLGSSTILTNSFDSYSTLLDAGTSHVIFSSNSSTLRALNGHTFYNVTFEGTNSQANDCNISGKLIFEADGTYYSNFNSTVNEVEFQQNGNINIYVSSGTAHFGTVTFGQIGNINMNSSTGSVYFGTVEFQQSGNIYNNGNPAQPPFFQYRYFFE